MDLNDIQPGGEVVFIGAGWGENTQRRIVARLTRTQIIIHGLRGTERRFSKKDGREVGNYKCRIEPMTPEVRASLIHKEKLARLRGIDFTTLAPLTVDAMLAAYDATT